MPRYIDADEALRMMRNSKQDNPCNTPGKGIWKTAHDCCMSCVDSVSTADVVPKSEVENLKVLLEINEKSYESLKELYRIDTDALVEARRKTEVEVAMEVAYDFQNRLRHIFLDMCNYNDYETLNLLQIDSAIEALYDTFFPELKKKYTEGENQCADERG